MFDTAMFVVGTFIFLLYAAGLGFTILEFRRFDDEDTKTKRQSNKL
jgi:hypothetical protein